METQALVEDSSLTNAMTTKEPAVPVPTIGRIVHYQAHGSPNGEHKAEARPAIVTKVFGDTLVCCIAVFNPTGMFFNEAKHGGPGVPGSWFWPPR